VQQQLLPKQPRPDRYTHRPGSRPGEYILLITILVAFLEATARQIKPVPPALVMGFSGVKGGALDWS
jgi:hypothetical protein